MNEGKNMRKAPELPWVEKYRPKRTKEMIGFTSNVKKIKDFIKKFEELHKSGKKLKVSQKAVLLEGPPGIGKTTVVYAVANDLGYNVVEMNASDVRTETAILETLQESVSSTDLLSFITPKKMLKKIILIDEVDGISGRSDRGGIKAILELVKKTKNPIIMTSNFRDPRFRKLYDSVTKFICRKLQKISIVKLLKNIAEQENLSVENKVIEVIAQNASGDMRSAINDLQALAQGVFSDVEFLDLHRDIEEKIYSFLKNMFEQKTIKDARDILSNIDYDYKILHKIIHSNISNILTSKRDFREVLINLVDADNLMNQIMTRMDFSLLPYFFDLVSGGVILSTSDRIAKGYTKFKMPNLANLRFRYANNETLEGLQKYFFKSKLEIANHIFPQLRTILTEYDSDEIEMKLEEISNEFEVPVSELKKLLK